MKALSLVLLGALSVQAAVDPPGCSGNNSELQLVANTNGPSILYRIVLTNPAQPNCKITNVWASIRLPNKGTINVLTNVALEPGQSIICPGNALCLTNTAGFGYGYTVVLADAVSIDPTQCPPSAGSVLAFSARATGAAEVLNGKLNGAKTYSSCTNILRGK